MSRTHKRIYTNPDTSHFSSGSRKTLPLYCTFFSSWQKFNLEKGENAVSFPPSAFFSLPTVRSNTKGVFTYTPRWIGKNGSVSYIQCTASMRVCLIGKIKIL